VMSTVGVIRRSKNCVRQTRDMAERICVCGYDRSQFMLSVRGSFSVIRHSRSFTNLGRE
jgi:hypothetical protein